MIIDVRVQLLSSALPLRCAYLFTGSAVPVRVASVPAVLDGRRVTGVVVSVTNADGVTLSVPCELRDGDWYTLLSAANFAHYGFVRNGQKVYVQLGDDTQLLGVGDVEIIQAQSEAAPGSANTFYAVKGSDCYIKSVVVNGMQHYVKQTVMFDPEIGWGADWSGDYILDDSGEFIEVVNQEGEG